MTASLNAVIIGAGPHGRRVAQALASRPDLSRLTVVDTNPTALTHKDVPAAAERLTDLGDALATAPDLLCIATNGPSHMKLAIRALEAGVQRLMVSKPFACSVAECQQILGAAERANARIAVDHIRRLHPTYRHLRDQVASGRWGVPRALYMQRPGIGLGCNGTHSFDAVRFILGREATSVVGFVDAPRGPNPRGADFVDPGGLSVIQLDGDVRAVVAQVEDGAGPTSLEIDLTGARVRYDERTGSLEVVEKDMSIKPGPGRPASFRVAENPAGVDAVVDMQQGLTSLFDELMGTSTMDCDAVHGLRSIQILAATYASSRSGNLPVSPLASANTDLWMPIT